MIIHRFGHWGGNAERYCGELVIVADSQVEAGKLALLARVLDNLALRARLFDHLEAKDYGNLPSAEVLGGAHC